MNFERIFKEFITKVFLGRQKYFLLLEMKRKNLRDYFYSWKDLITKSVVQPLVEEPIMSWSSIRLRKFVGTFKIEVEKKNWRENKKRWELLFEWNFGEIVSKISKPLKKVSSTWNRSLSSPSKEFPQRNAHKNLGKKWHKKLNNFTTQKYFMSVFKPPSKHAFYY